MPIGFSISSPLTLSSLHLDTLCCIKVAGEPRRHAHKTRSALRIGPTHLQFWNVTQSLTTGDSLRVFAKLTSVIAMDYQLWCGSFLLLLSCLLSCSFT